MAIDTSTWRLPGFVDHGVCRDDQDESYLASRGVAVLRKDRPPAVGQQAAIEVHLFGDLGWGIIKGLVSEVGSDGRLVVGATLTSDGAFWMRVFEVARSANASLRIEQLDACMIHVIGSTHRSDERRLGP